MAINPATGQEDPNYVPPADPSLSTVQSSLSTADSSLSTGVSSLSTSTSTSTPSSLSTGTSSLSTGTSSLSTSGIDPTKHETTPSLSTSTSTSTMPDVNSNPSNAPDDHVLANIGYNQDGSVRNPALPEEEGQSEEDKGPPGMPAVQPADGPWSRDVIPTGWSRFPTDEEVAYLNDKYPKQEGAPYQPGGHGVEDDKVVDTTGGPGTSNASNPYASGGS